MATDTTAGHSGMDYDAHAQTYRGFVRGTKLAVVATAATLILMAVFLV